MFDRFKKIFGFGYDAVESSNRRKARMVIIKSEDDTLTATNRKRLIATAQDQVRNFAIAQWMIRKHLDYVSRFTFQSKTGDAEFDWEMERRVAEWSRPQNCDIAGRHSLQRFISLCEMRRVVDGDVGVLRLQSGHLQAIEGDRIRFIAPMAGKRLSKPDGSPYIEKDFIHGVLLGDGGRARAYAICTRNGGALEFERLISATNVSMLGYYTRFDQVRGISPLASALNTLSDLYESYEYQLIKAKMHSMFGVAIISSGDNSLGGEGSGLPVTADETTIANSTTFETKLKSGSILDLEPGEDIKMIESHTPSAEFMQYAEVMTRVALLALDIPYSIFDVSETTYSGGRTDWLGYIQSAKSKRADLREWLDEIIRWKLMQWILDSKNPLRIPSEYDVETLPFEWQAIGIPWIDPLKEITANLAAINGGISSRTRVCRELGYDFEDVVRELQREDQLIAAANITLKTEMEKGAA